MVSRPRDWSSSTAKLTRSIPSFFFLKAILALTAPSPRRPRRHPLRECPSCVRRGAGVLTAPRAQILFYYGPAIRWRGKFSGQAMRLQQQKDEEKRAQEKQRQDA